MMRTQKMVLDDYERVFNQKQKVRRLTSMCLGKQRRAGFVRPPKLVGRA